MNNLFLNKLHGEKRLLIVGYGREGHSTLRWILQNFPDMEIGIADKNKNIGNDRLIKSHKTVSLFLGEKYLQSLNDYKIIIKSPGILFPEEIIKEKVVLSQTELFLQKYHKQIIGVTGTKGKSTTASLITHFLSYNNNRTILLGNIGTPAFDKLTEITDNTYIVFELSAHQLKNVKHSPHIGVLLNIFPEHLDFFKTLQAYTLAKYNILKYKTKDDFSIDGTMFKPYDFSDDMLTKVASKLLNEKIIPAKLKNISPLKGNHNIYNIIMAMAAAQKTGISVHHCLDSLPTFKPLPHRLEYVGTVLGVSYYNDSISTVPQSTIAAVKSLQHVDVLILGGFNRGIDYSPLVNFLAKSPVSIIYVMGKAGDEIYRLFTKLKTKTVLIKVKNLKEAISLIKQLKNIKLVLLSPAAASYDAFRNFEQRGDAFREFVMK